MLGFRFRSVWSGFKSRVGIWVFRLKGLGPFKVYLGVLAIWTLGFKSLVCWVGHRAQGFKTIIIILIIQYQYIYHTITITHIRNNNTTNDIMITNNKM